MKRAPLALAAATIALAAVSVAVPDGLRDSTQTRASASPQPVEIAAATPTPSTFVRPIWRLDIPKGGGPFAARVSPDARMVAVETGARSGGAVLYEIRPPVAPSDVAELREIVKLDGAASPDASPHQAAAVRCEATQLRTVLLRSAHARISCAIAANSEYAEVRESVGLRDVHLGRVIDERTVLGPDRRRVADTRLLVGQPPRRPSCEVPDRDASGVRGRGQRHHERTAIVAEVVAKSDGAGK